VRCAFCETEIDGNQPCQFCGRISYKHSYNYPQRLKPENVRSLIAELRNGFTITTAARRSGVTYLSAQNYAHYLIGNLGEMIYCPCGRPRSHAGFCPWRIVHDDVWKFSAERRARRALRLPAAVGVCWRPEEEVIRGVRCKEKACPFGAADEISELCEYHKHFFDFDISLTDTSVDRYSISKSEDQREHFLGDVSVIGVRAFRMGSPVKFVFTKPTKRMGGEGAVAGR